MMITVLAAGSRGDVQPFVALAFGLKRAGYRVRLAANRNFQSLAADYGVDFFPLNFDSRAFITDQPVQAWLSSGNLLQLALNTRRVIQPTLVPLLKDAWAACQGSELIIYHSFTLPTVYDFGQMLNVPCLPVSPYPLPTRAHPALPLNIKTLGGRLNLTSHKLLQLFSWQLYRSSARELLGPKWKLPSGRLFRPPNLGHLPVLCCYSPVVVPCPPDLAPQVHVAGYWFLEPAPAWKPGRALVDFLQSGPPPVFVGFASMGNPSLAVETTEMVLNALAQTGQRGLLVSGWSGLGHGISLPDSVFMLDHAPYSWLLPQMAVIVHHGGAGTTGAALAAGVPNVVIPHFSDNFFWARRVHALGSAPRPIPRQRLSAARLAQALTVAVNDRSMLSRAAATGQQIRAENGVARAVAVVEQFLGAISTGGDGRP